MNEGTSKQTGPQTVCIQGGTVIDPGHVNGRADVLIQDDFINYPLVENPDILVIMSEEAWQAEKIEKRREQDVS